MVRICRSRLHNCAGINVFVCVATQVPSIHSAPLSFLHQSLSLSATVTQTSLALSHHTLILTLLINTHTHTHIQYESSHMLSASICKWICQLFHLTMQGKNVCGWGEKKNLEEVRNISLQPWMLRVDKETSLWVCNRLYILAHMCVSVL